MKNIFLLFILISGLGCTNAQQPQNQSKAQPELNDDKGINVKLPPWSDEELDVNSFDKRNVLTVWVNKKNELIVRDKKMEVNNLKTRVKEFIVNPDKNPLYAIQADKAIVSLGNDRGTDYKIYLKIYNEIKAAYNELHDEQANKSYGKAFKELNRTQQKEIRSIIPIVISEAEPTDFD